MKKFVFSVLFCLASLITVIAQVKEDRISAIRKMYSEVQALQKNKSALKCSTGKDYIYEGLTLESDKIKFEQLASKCILPKLYIVYDGRFAGYEWYENVSIYMNNDTPFFAYFKTASESCESETRLYFDNSGNIIKYLYKSTNCEEQDGSIEVKDKEKINSMAKNVSEVLAKMDKMIKK